MNPPNIIPENPPSPVDPVLYPTPPITAPANPPTENTPVPDPTSPTTHVVPVPDTPPPTSITPTLVADFHGVKWHDSKHVINLDKVPSLQWNFTNKFDDPVYSEI